MSKCIINVWYVDIRGRGIDILASRQREQYWHREMKRKKSKAEKKIKERK